jgi:hypothetical protein
MVMGFGRIFQRSTCIRIHWHTEKENQTCINFGQALQRLNQSSIGYVTNFRSLVIKLGFGRIYGIIEDLG